MWGHLSKTVRYVYSTRKLEGILSNYTLSSSYWHLSKLHVKKRQCRPYPYYKIILCFAPSESSINIYRCDCSTARKQVICSNKSYTQETREQKCSFPVSCVPREWLSVHLLQIVDGKLTNSQVFLLLDNARMAVDDFNLK